MRVLLSLRASVITLRFASRFFECFALRYCHKFERLRVCYVLKLRASVMLRASCFIIIASRFASATLFHLFALYLSK